MLHVVVLDDDDLEWPRRLRRGMEREGVVLLMKEHAKEEGEDMGMVRLGIVDMMTINGL